MTEWDSDIITRILPHREPFLFVDRILGFNGVDCIETQLSLAPGLAFFKGHFPGQPILPGVLVTEALAQSCGLLLGLKYQNDSQKAQKRYFLARSEMKFVQPAYPREVLRMEAKLTKVFGPMCRFDVAASVAERTVAGGVLSLARQPE